MPSGSPGRRYRLRRTRPAATSGPSGRGRHGLLRPADPPADTAIPTGLRRRGRRPMRVPAAGRRRHAWCRRVGGPAGTRRPGGRRWVWRHRRRRFRAAVRRAVSGGPGGCGRRNGRRRRPWRTWCCPAAARMELVVPGGGGSGQRSAAECLAAARVAAHQAMVLPAGLPGSGVPAVYRVAAAFRRRTRRWCCRRPGKSVSPVGVPGGGTWRRARCWLAWQCAGRGMPARRMPPPARASPATAAGRAASASGAPTADGYISGRPAGDPPPRGPRPPRNRPPRPGGPHAAAARRVAADAGRPAETRRGLRRQEKEEVEAHRQAVRRLGAPQGLRALLPHQPAHPRQLLSGPPAARPGGGHRPAKIIAMTGRTAAAVDPLVTAIWEQMDAWGIAGKGMYWRPILQVYVAPGAEQRFAGPATLAPRQRLDHPEETVVVAER